MQLGIIPVFLLGAYGDDEQDNKLSSNIIVSRWINGMKSNRNG